ncbi:transcriptional regulator [Anaeromicropila populeti]|uniref:PAS fold-containing protein n=1 Tax=Anaeromicropila populeti TaxID=37658 RepID=A0A1I6IYT3_9FIRM|nr:hypothetical protein [Anaeromicropila populeti]SFR71400.1 hypothetical protein SAMN05661086_01218 [Anaeromicropila populeti]
MTILQGDIIIKISILLTLILILIIFNVYLFVRRKRSIVTLEIHFISLSLLGFLVCKFISTAILNLEFEKYYKMAECFFLVCGIILCIIYVLLQYSSKKNTYMHFQFPPDIQRILSTIFDCILICDYEGHIYCANNEERYKRLFGNQCIKQQVIEKMFLELAPRQLHKEIENCFQNKNINVSFEVYFPKINEYYLVKIVPILVGKNSIMGKMISLHDITGEKQLMDEINQKNINLEKVNKRLVHYVEAANVLESEKARLDLLEGIQTELIERIEEIVQNTFIIENRKYSDVFELHKDVSNVSMQLRSIYKMIRKTIQNMYIKEGEQHDNSTDSR